MPLTQVGFAEIAAQEGTLVLFDPLEGVLYGGVQDSGQEGRFDIVRIPSRVAMLRLGL